MVTTATINTVTIAADGSMPAKTFSKNRNYTLWISGRRTAGKFTGVVNTSDFGVRYEFMVDGYSELLSENFIGQSI